MPIIQNGVVLSVASAPGRRNLTRCAGSAAVRNHRQQRPIDAMRDGVRLATDIYRPARNGVAVECKFPVVMERTPYDKSRSTYLITFVADGYVDIELP
jgi:predicted acyl esterase